MSDAERKQNDDAMLAALKRHMAVDGAPLHVWAERLRVPFMELVETLDGSRPVSNEFWAGVRRVFLKDV